MRGKRFRDIGVQSPTRKSHHNVKVLRNPQRHDLSRESGNGSRVIRVFDGFLDGDRDEHYQGFSFSQGLPLIESPFMKFQWENLLEKLANLGGNGKLTMDVSSGYGADVYRMETEKGYTQSGFMGTVSKSMSMVNKRARAFDFSPCPSNFGPTNISDDIDGGFSSPQGNLNIEFHNENIERFPSPNMGSYMESVPMRKYLFETKLLGAEVDEDICIPYSLPVDEFSLRKAHGDLRIQGHSLAVDIEIQGHRPVYKLSATESCESIQIQDHLIVDKTFGMLD